MTSPTTVTFSVGTAMGVTFHSSNLCTTTPSNSVIIGAGSSSSTLYARGTTPVNAMLTASTAGLTSTVQPLTFVDGPDTLVFTNAPPTPLRAGFCFALSYQSRRAGAASPVASNVTVSFASTPTGSVRYYSDAACTAPTTSQVLTAGSSTDSVFVRVLTGSAPVTIQAGAALMTAATATTTALPMVRRGNCSFTSQAWTLVDGGNGTLVDGGPVADTFASCNLNPQPISRDATMMVFQAITSGAYQDAMVRCRLPSGGDLTCSRRTGVSSANVHWQIVEIPSGLRVVHIGSSSCQPSFTLPAVDPAKTFLLRSVSNRSSSYDDEDAPVFTLTGPTSVTLSNATCDGLELQAVEWTGVTVNRGALDGGMDAGVALASVMASPGAPPQRTALLTQTGTRVNAELPTCGMMARGFMSGPSEVNFSRALGDGGCASFVADFIAHERIDFGSLATVQERTLTFLPGQTTQSPVITSVDTTRTFVFASNQSAMGQGMGETNMPVTSLPGEAAFILELPSTPTATTLTVRRARSTSTAVVTLYIVQVE
ncbi:MAG: hypothetical protein Q8N26_27530 [Myxococcales bacterium]|nr:hypothetical protein [Myxococcales bacterium]